MEALRYPLGRFAPPATIQADDLKLATAQIAEFPHHLQVLLQSITAPDWQKTYRPGGWTLLQVVHHCADSHSQAFARFKLALTEDQPTIKPYAEAHWAEGPDYEAAGQDSVLILRGLHARWADFCSKCRLLTGKEPTFTRKCKDL
ncbi:MAG: metal-dependent hydrolase [Microscillaceae bacterium]|nr:metal-dependent hydrolase [Microscillaceae bacterium]